jgi:hypothetical protein
LAENLVNITHSKLNTISEEKLTDKSKADIVALVTTIREEFKLRTVSESNMGSILRKLGEIQAVFDSNYNHIESEEEKVSTDNKDAKEGVSMETDTKAQCAADKTEDKMDESITDYTDNSKDKVESEADVSVISNNTESVPVSGLVINKHQNNDKDKGKSDFKVMADDSDIDAKLGKSSLPRTRSKSRRSTDEQIQKDITVSVNKVKTVGKDCTGGNERNEIVIYVDDIKEENGETNVKTLEHVARGLKGVGPDCVGLTERIKLDGTEVDVSAR